MIVAYKNGIHEVIGFSLQKMTRIILTSVVALLFATACYAGERPISDCGDRILHDGYPMERHTVTTDDGYILTMHRIPYSPKTGSTKNRPVALLMHGMLSSSSDWVLMGPGKALAYILADAGYDVWLGNARGNTYSKKHKVYSTTWKSFWNFSWHEIGVYDVPAKIDYILKLTGQKQLQYVGHSQGTTVYLVMMSEKPSYNAKIKSSHLLGPAAYMGNMISPLTRTFAPYLGLPNAYPEVYGSVEYMATSEAKQDAGIEKCQVTSPYVEMCANSIFLIGGYDTEQLDYALLEHIMAVSPAGASINQNMHFCQEHLSKKFRKFDYSAMRNPVEYGSMSAPDYIIENALAPVMLYYGANDWMVDVGDVKQLIARLPNLKLDYLVPFDKWAHLDFVWGTEAKKYVYDKVLEQMRRYE